MLPFHVPAYAGYANQPPSLSIARKITDAIMTSEDVFKNRHLNEVVTHLLTAALTGLQRSPAQAREKARQLTGRHLQIISSLAAPAEQVDTGQARPALPAVKVRSLHNSSGWVRPTKAVLSEVVREMDITEPEADEVITPISRCLLDKMYRSGYEYEVLDAGERLDTRMQMKQAQQQNAQLLVRNDQLQNTTDQLHGEVRHLHSERQAQQATLVDLSAGINAMQATLEDTPAKVELVKLGDHVARLVQANQRSDGVVRKLEQSLSKLEAEADPGAPPGSGQVQVQLSRAQGRRGVTGQQADLEEVKAHANLMSLAITDLQGRLGDETVKALPDPNDDSKRRQLFGKLPSKGSRQ